MKSQFLMIILSSLMLLFTICECSYSHSLDRELVEKRNSIDLACKAVQYTQLCKSSLNIANVGENAKAKEMIRVAIELSINATIASHENCKVLLSSSHNINDTKIAAKCLELLEAARHYMERSKSAPFHLHVKDAEAWLSASLTWQFNCNSSLDKFTLSHQVHVTVKQLVISMNLTSNALSMVNALDNYGVDMALWKPPMSERLNSTNTTQFSHGPSKLSKNEAWRNFAIKNPFSADVIISKNGSSSTSIQQVIDKAPKNSKKNYVIYVKEGVYEEIVSIPRTKPNIVLIGDGMDKTVITGSRKVDANTTTVASATFTVNADGFIARGITFQNAAGPPTTQAVALLVDGDLAAFFDCAILGHQDSLCANTLRQYYKNCRIEGNVDFIFGNSASVFENCIILVRPRQDGMEKGSQNPLTAHGRMDLAQTTGYVFHNCTINGTEEYISAFHAQPNRHKAYLGRPWKTFSRTIFMNSYLGEIISPEGWLPWNGDFALDTLFYGEYGNYGPGANITKRVPWSNVLNDGQIEKYSPKNFIQSEEWLTPLNDERQPSKLSPSTSNVSIMKRPLGVLILLCLFHL